MIVVLSVNAVLPLTKNTGALATGPLLKVVQL